MGEVLGCVAVQVRACWKPQVAEAKAIMEGLSLAREIGASNVEIEGRIFLI